ncbi:prepilin peptidase [Mannheimia pernigra]|uniref:prepilin peptidase n=1 Tax=Mannheimia pernigra TaxID=111844 RepID=UPI001315B83E|nr:prepilin peptidase [Mannheimia pernigra]QHB17625.1 peptidase A24 [Mannheimia pernigra]
MWLLLSFLSAFWFKTEMPRFAIRINQQIYQAANSINQLNLTEQQFIALSSLKPQQTRWANLFFLLFPLIMYCSENPIMGGIFILLCFLSLLDICYYLTDTRYIGLIFLLVLWESVNHFHNQTLLFTSLFCLFIALFSFLVFKKETFGFGDMLLLLALSPLFNIEKMLLLILTACLLGIFYYLAYWWIKKQKLAKLAFIPFISLAVGIVVTLESRGINY